MKTSRGKMRQTTRRVCTTLVHKGEYENKRRGRSRSKKAINARDVFVHQKKERASERMKSKKCVRTHNFGQNIMYNVHDIKYDVEKV